MQSDPDNMYNRLAKSLGVDLNDPSSQLVREQSPMAI
eukprot:CAMPEP_0170480186 /NCGR_PEP_ID=MMETSP0208-20121228/1130_1 /TAXON_ID=197538 /ORGANISM="Strombidium inclinatum, Strain S3" /LENGTH=36 /DNA_ID= /DNA_START= /DNA_END= /DNA_ORIENTATION=